MTKEKTLAMILEYDGTNFSGWQIQPNARTIQQEIENAMKVLTGRDISIIGAGRTDSGVHANGMVAHAKIDDDFPIPENKLAIAINSRLPADVRIKKAKFFEIPFHARFDAVAREYSYAITTEETVFNRFFQTYYK